MLYVVLGTVFGPWGGERATRGRANIFRYVLGGFGLFDFLGFLGYKIHIQILHTSKMLRVVSVYRGLQGVQMPTGCSGCSKCKYFLKYSTANINFSVEVYMA